MGPNSMMCQWNEIKVGTVSPKGQWKGREGFKTYWNSIGGWLGQRVPNLTVLHTGFEPGTAVPRAAHGDAHKKYLLIFSLVLSISVTVGGSQQNLHAKVYSSRLKFTLTFQSHNKQLQNYGLKLKKAEMNFRSHGYAYLLSLINR